MNSMTRFAAVIVGAVLLSLLSVVPAFGDGSLEFIDPDDINPDGTLSDNTPDEQEWARQGGHIGLMLSEDDLDVPIKRVLIPSIDATAIGTGDVGAHTATISNARSSVSASLTAGDYVLIGQNTVRKVESVNGNSTVTLDVPFAKGMSNAMVYRINDSVTDLDVWDDNYSSYAMAEVIDGATLRRLGSGFAVSRYRSQHGIADSDVATSVSGSGVTVLDRLSGSGTGSINTKDVLVVRVSSATSTAIRVDDVSGDRVEMDDVPGATTTNPLGLASDEAAYLVYWAEERNETGSVVTIRSRVRPGPVTVVLTETTPRSGTFVLEIATVVPLDEHGNRLVSDLSASPPTLPVNPRDAVTLATADASATLQVESSPPLFSGLSPAHNTAMRERRPEVTARVTDSESGLKDRNISVFFRIIEGSVSRTVELVSRNDGEVDPIPDGFEVRQRLPGAYAPSGDAVIEWWVKAVDNAGNVGYSDSEPSRFVVDNTEISLLRAETGRHWDTSLDTGDSDDKTEYRVSRADPTSVLVVFDEHLDDATVAAADFEVDGDTPNAAEVRNVTVRDDSRGGDGNSSIAGDDVRDVGLDRGYVFLTVEEMSPDAQPRIELVGSVSDLAGNRRNNGSDNAADDRMAPVLTVTVAEGDRPVTKDTVALTISSNEDTFSPLVSYYRVMSSNSVQTLGVERRAASVVFNSNTEYTATVDPSDDGLYTVYVTTQDASGGNRGSKGDNSAPVDVDGETSAILFERDTSLPAPDVNPYLAGAQDDFSTDDPNAVISIDFSGEGSEYYGDTRRTVTIVSATLGGSDITDELQPNQDGTVFTYRASDLTIGDHTLSVTAMDEAGNTADSASEIIRCNPGQSDCISPTVFMSVTPTDFRVRTNLPIPVTATFSEAVSEFDVNDISVTNGTAGNFAGSDGDSVYTFDVTPTAIGEVTVDIPASVAEDASGNGNTGVVRLSLGVPYDDDFDGRISRAEVVNAISDYISGSNLISRSQVLALISLYLFG